MELNISFLVKPLKNYIYTRVSDITRKGMHLWFIYKWISIWKYTESNLSNSYFSNARACPIPFVTCITQFYTLQTTRCDNILYSLCCKSERNCLHLKSVLSPIEMKTSENLLFLPFSPLASHFYIYTWPKCPKCHLFIAQPCASSPTWGTWHWTNSPSALGTSVYFTRINEWASTLQIIFCT